MTGRPRADAEYVLARFEVRDYFDVLVAMEDVPVGKPDPSGIEMAAGKLGVKRVAYIGDTIDDLRAAIAAHALPIGVVSQGGSAVEQRPLLEQHGAKFVLDDVNEVLEVLK